MQLILTGQRPHDVTGLVTYVRWSGDREQVARVLEFGLVCSPVDKLVPVIPVELGNAVALYDDEGELFRGHVFGLTRSTGGSVMDVECYDGGIYLKNNYITDQIDDLSPSGAAKQLLKKMDLEAGELAAAEHTFSRVFFNVSLYAALMTGYKQASDKNGKVYQLVMSGGKVNIIESGANEKILMLEGGTNIMEAVVSQSITGMVNQVEIYDRDGKLKTVIKDEKAVAAYGALQAIVKESEEGRGQEQAQGMIDKNGVDSKITVDNLGDPSLVTGCAVAVREPYTGICGLFYIKSDAHSWKNGVYTNKLTLVYENQMTANQAGELPKAGKTGSGKSRAQDGGAKEELTWDWDGTFPD